MKKITRLIHNKRGFTLIELLLVILIISLLAVTVFVALSPAKRLQDSRNARRTTDVATILDAIHTSIVDNKGALPSGMPAAGVEAQLGTGNAAACSPVGSPCAVLDGQACVNPTLTSYLASLPIDPAGGTAYTSAKTGYSVVVDTNGIVTVKACGAEGTTITASR